MTSHARSGLARALGATGLAVLALAGCQSQPVGVMQSATFRAEPAQAQTDLYFQPGSGQLLRGESARLRTFLAALALRSTDDVLVDLPSTGSAAIDGQRRAALFAAIGPVPARVDVTGRRGFPLADPRADEIFVQVRRYDRLVVDCTGLGARADERAWHTPVPLIGCANAANRAGMAASLRDLTAPQDLSDAPAQASVEAVGRYRRGETKPPPFSLTGF